MYNNLPGELKEILDMMKSPGWGYYKERKAKMIDSLLISISDRTPAMIDLYKITGIIKALNEMVYRDEERIIAELESVEKELDNANNVSAPEEV